MFRSPFWLPLCPGSCDFLARVRGRSEGKGPVLSKIDLLVTVVGPGDTSQKTRCLYCRGFKGSAGPGTSYTRATPRNGDRAAVAPAPAQSPACGSTLVSFSCSGFFFLPGFTEAPGFGGGGCPRYTQGRQVRLEVLLAGDQCIRGDPAALPALRKTEDGSACTVGSTPG